MSLSLSIGLKLGNVRIVAPPVAGDGPVISLVTFDENTDISEISTDTLNGNYHWARQNPGDADAVFDPATDTWSGTFAESGVIAVPATSPASFDIPETGTTGQNYKIRFVQESAAGEISNYLTINYTADNTAPVHSWALTSGDALLGAVLTVDEVAQVSWVLTTSATVPSTAQIIAGQDDTGAAAVSSGQINPAGIGAQASFDITGLTNGTAYHIHSTQADTHGNVGVATATETPLISGLPVHVESATLVNDTGFISQFNSSLHGPGLTSVSGGTDRYVLFKVTSVMGGAPADLSLTTMTYGGISCDLIVHSPASSGQPAALLFALKEADIPAGANETAIAFNASVRSCIVHYELYSNVDQVTPIPVNGTRNDFGNSTLEPFLGITIQENDSAIVGAVCVPTSINTLNRVERRATDGTTVIGPAVARASDYTEFTTGSATSDHFGVSFGYTGPPAGVERSYVVMNDDGDGPKNFAIVLAELNGA